LRWGQRRAGERRKFLRNPVRARGWQRPQRPGPAGLCPQGPAIVASGLRRVYHGGAIGAGI